MRDIEFPDGLVLEGVPDDVDDMQVLSFLKQNHPDTYRIALHTQTAPGAGFEQAAEGMGFLDSAMVAAGGAVDAIRQGIEALGPGATEDVVARLRGEPDRQQERVAQEAAERRAIMAPLEEEQPGATMLGAALPAFAIPMGIAGQATGRALTGLGARGLGQRVAGSAVADAALTGGLLGAADYDATAAGGAVGGALGGLLGAGTAKVLRPTLERLTPSGQRAVGTAEGIGMRVSPGQATGSRPLQQFEASMQSSPIASGAFQRTADANQAAMNRAAAQSIGETSDVVTDDVLDAAYRRIGGEFDRIANEAGDVPVDTTLVDDVLRQIDEYESFFGEKLPGSDRLLQKLSAPTIPGKDLLGISSMLGKASRSAFRGQNSNPERGFAIAGMKEALDDALMRTVGGQVRADLGQARQQWRNLVTLFEPGVIPSPTKGDISAATLGNKLRARDRSGFMRGTRDGPLDDVARIGKAFPQIADSGTATRLTAPILAATAAGGAGAALQNDPVSGAATLALPLALLYGGARAYNTPLMQRYLTRGVPGLGSEAALPYVRGLLGRAGVAGGLLSAEP